MAVQVKRRPYFREITATADDDRASWEEALDLWALGLARSLSLEPEETPGSVLDAGVARSPSLDAGVVRSLRSDTVEPRPGTGQHPPEGGPR